jgi:AcrR family transcriptional regulator
MSREQAADYEDKKNAIMDAAASLFSQVGYPNAKLLDVAKACGASKSMIYHYFATKDDLLFALLSEHLQQTISALEQIDARTEPAQRLRNFIEVYTQKSSETRTRHLVAMNDVKYLPKSMQTSIVVLERRIVRLFEEVLIALDTGAAAHFTGPNSMLLMGMLNWIDLWYRPSGRIKPDELCDHITNLFLHGYLRPAAPAPRKRNSNIHAGHVR